jgi:glycolate oxidase iron-sulfur subunit
MSPVTQEGEESRASAAIDLLRGLDYSVLQQCIHCGMCLPTCPTYDLTKQERNSPRGRISLMRSIADGDLNVTKAFSEEMYFCLGCLACETACPAGVKYGDLFETARAAAEKSGELERPIRQAVRSAAFRGLFMHPRLLRLAGRMLWIYQASGMQRLFRASGLRKLLPERLRALEEQTPVAKRRFSHQLIRPVERPQVVRYRVAVLTGCVQDIVFSDINRDTVDVLLANNCEVYTPPVQPCCGSLHSHNGDVAAARELARRSIALLDPSKFDAIISNAAGCGSHLKKYSHLLHDDPLYSERARQWDTKVKDIHEWLAEIGFRAPRAGCGLNSVTYHEACHLCHGQKITRQPREALRAIPGLSLIELAESTWCCGSAGTYSIVQPETATELQQRKVTNVREAGVQAVATSNPGCHLQIENGLQHAGSEVSVVQPISLLARAYRAEEQSKLTRK